MEAVHQVPALGSMLGLEGLGEHPPAYYERMVGTWYGYHAIYAHSLVTLVPLLLWWVPSRGAAPAWLWTLPFAIYVAHSTVFWGWIVDDAAISFAYSRTCAEGFGLTAQPGLPPVEGFSNPLWVLLLIPFFKLGLFDPYLTPKLLQWGLVGLVYYAVFRAARKVRPDQLNTVSCALLFLSLTTPFVIWTSSGLENALYVCLHALLFACVLSHIMGPDHPASRAGMAGLLSGLLVLTRPEGLVLGASAALLLAGYLPPWRNLRRAAVFVSMAVLSSGSYLLFRWFYYHDWVPNTFYAKVPVDRSTAEHVQQVIQQEGR